MLPKRSPYVHLLEEDETFRRWFENAQRGSQTYAAVCFRRIGNICKEYGTTPSDLARKNQKEVTTFLIDVVSMLEARGNAGSLIESYIKALKWWLTFNDIELVGEIKVDGVSETRTLVNERTPSQQELNQILNGADLREKVAIMFIAACGGRIEILGMYKGDDGLRVRDLPEMEVEVPQGACISRMCPQS